MHTIPISKRCRWKWRKTKYKCHTGGRQCCHKTSGINRTVRQGKEKVSREVRKGVWEADKDKLLRDCIQTFGEGKWSQIPDRAGLNRCRKSCRLRWVNYLNPNIKRGPFSTDEVDLVIRMHKLLGNRWSLIAGRIPGRTANDVKNYWNTHLKKKHSEKNKSVEIMAKDTEPKSQPRSFAENYVRNEDITGVTEVPGSLVQVNTSKPMITEKEDIWWEYLFLENGMELTPGDGTTLAQAANNNDLLSDSLFLDDDLWNMFNSTIT